MEKMLVIPKNRKRLNVGRLCLLLGLTVLLYLMVSHRLGSVAEAIISVRGG
jgi:hypothetical protein